LDRNVNLLIKKKVCSIANPEYNFIETHTAIFRFTDYDGDDDVLCGNSYL